MKRFILWQSWAKHCLNGWFYKLLVLLGLAHSPTFEIYFHTMPCKRGDRNEIKRIYH